MSPTLKGWLSSLSLGAALATAGIAAAEALPEAAAKAESRSGAQVATAPRTPPRRSDRFTLAVIPDTQYLFDEDRGNAEVLGRSLEWIRRNRVRRNIAFTVHLGDIVENGAAEELAQASRVFGLLDRSKLPYGVLAGNHDVDPRTDDTRGDTPYLEYFGPDRIDDQPTFCGATADGYNTCHLIRGGGRDWLLLALDWRISAGTLDWAQARLDDHPGVPTILVTHELIANDGSGGGVGVLSFYGQYLWEQLIKANSQIFLTLNGHYWPPARTVLKNDAGRDVHLHLANYQNRYFSGSGMIRLYEFDVAANRIEVSTFSPYWQSLSPRRRPPLAEDELALEDDANRFTINLDFEARFRAEAEPEPLPALPVEDLLVPGTLAYWRLENPGQAGAVVPEGGTAIEDLTGGGNDLLRVTLENGKAEDMTWTEAFHPAQPSRGSIFFNGSKRDPAFGGAYLRTVDTAPINALPLENGYTIEVFIRLPETCCGSKHAWMGAVSRMGSGRDAGKTGGDPSEPVGTFTISPGRQVQWAVFPLNDPGILTNWSFELPRERWFHVAIRNDGRQSEVFVDGSKIQRNPEALNVGISTTGEFWMVGATHYDRVIEQSFFGWIGDVRIVDRPLPVEDFMTAR